MLHKIKINETTLTKKPEGTLAGHISNNINTIKEVTIKQFSELVTQPYAYTWTPFYFEGKRNKNNWKSQSVFYLDFDNGSLLSDIIYRLDMLSLRPNVIYNTLSDTIQKRKYRVVFFLDGIIKCAQTANWIQSNLVKMFPDSDQSCSTIERMVYPGYSIQHLDEVENSGDDFIKIINSFIISQDKKGSNFQTRSVKNFEVLLNDDDTIEYVINFKNVKVNEVDTKLPEIIEKFDWNKSFKEIKILNDFNNGVRLKHMEIFGLATNLMYIKGGLSYMKKKMIEVNENKNRIDMFGNKAMPYIYQQFATLPQVKKMKYKPYMLNKFSPYKEDHDFTNILESVRWKRGRIDILETYEKIPLSLAEKTLHEEFYNKVKKLNEEDKREDVDLFDMDTYPDFENTITIFKVPTGLGKTKELETLKNALIATKTNSLKRELSDRMKVEHYVTPDYPVFTDEDINTMISNYTNSNLFEETSKLITKISNGCKIQLFNKKVFTPTELDINQAKVYKEDNALCRETNSTVITTHTRVILDNSFNHDTVIFDECPLDSLIEMGSYVFNFSIFDGTEFEKDIKPIEDWVRKDLGFNQIVKTPTFVVNNYTKFCELCAISGESNLIRLLDSNFVYRDNNSSSSRGEVIFATKRRIPNKNIVIMSATAPIEIYRYVFGNRLEVIDVSNVEKKGSIKQYTGKSWSRSSFLKSSEKSRTELLELIGDRPVITFRSFKKMFKNPAPFHFGNTLGYDELKGQDIAVVGTDNKPLYVYFFYAKIIGMDLKTSDNILDVRIVDWNGFKFKTMTFENEILRNIQLSMIESELIQAVGRNRNLREDCETLLFSNQPLKISDEFIND
jgi:hypothetical protein